MAGPGQNLGIAIRRHRGSQGGRGRAPQPGSRSTRATEKSPEDSSAAAGSAGESDHAELALRLIVRNPRHEPAAAVAMIGFTR